MVAGWWAVMAFRVKARSRGRYAIHRPRSPNDSSSLCHNDLSYAFECHFQALPSCCSMSQPEHLKHPSEWSHVESWHSCGPEEADRRIPGRVCSLSSHCNVRVLIILSELLDFCLDFLLLPHSRHTIYWKNIKRLQQRYRLASTSWSSVQRRSYFDQRSKNAIFNTSFVRFRHMLDA